MKYRLRVRRTEIGWFGAWLINDATKQEQKIGELKVPQGSDDQKNLNNNVQAESTTNKRQDIIRSESGQPDNKAGACAAQRRRRISPPRRLAWSRTAVSQAPVVYL